MEYSLSIGIDKYLDTSLDKTPFAEKDAVSVSRVIGEQFDLEENIVLIGEEATKDNINSKLNFIVSKLKENDRVLFFFAGHGSNIYNEPRISCYDSKNDANNNIYTWYDLKEVMGKVAEKKANLICFIDACESTINYSSRGDRQSHIYENKYLYVFSSANYSEEAKSDRNLEHGIWTHFLLKALKGDKEALIDNCLTNSSLQNFLNNKVISYYADNGEIPCQTPQSWGKLSKEFVIKEYSKEAKKDEILIKDIYFGTVDADNEMREEPDKFIHNYFDLNCVSEKLVNKDNIQVVIGRKGTGKTYTGMYLERVSAGKVKYLAMDNFDYKALKFLAQAGSGYEQYVLPWKYFILAQFLMHINKVIECDEIKEILKVLYGRKATNYQILHKKFKRGIQLSNVDISNRWKEELAKEDDYFQLQDIAQIFLYLVEDYVKQDYLFILDGLDEKINENSNYKDMMNGLIWAVKGLNDEFYEYKKSVKIAAFFRKDVFDFVQGANTAKIASGSTINLDWVSDSGDKKKYPLYQFMNIRYKNCLEELGIEKGKTELADILPPFMEIGNEKVDTWDWILNFTTYKPRDVVKLLSECQNKCINNEKYITKEILWEAQPEYSKYLVKELKNELYGFIDENLINAIFEKLQSMHTGWKDYQFIKAIIVKSANGIGSEFDNQTINGIVIKLYEVGILGIQLPNMHEQWYYRKYMKINDYIERSKYKLHQGLWKAFSIW